MEANGAGGSNGAGRKGRDGGGEGFGGRKGGKFMEGVPGVSHFTLQVGIVFETLLDISVRCSDILKCQDESCDWWTRTRKKRVGRRGDLL